MMFMIKRGDQEFGPYSGTDIRQYLSSGNIVETDLVRAEGSDRWLTVQEILGGKAAQPQAASPTPTPQPMYTPEPSPAPAPMFDPSPAPQPYGAGPSSGFGTGSTPSYGSDPGFGSPAPVTPSWGSPEAAAPQYSAAATSAPSNTMKNGAPLPPNMNWILVAVISMVCGFFALFVYFQQTSWVKKIDPQSKATRNLILGLLAIVAMYVLIFVGAFLPAISEDLAILSVLVAGVAWLGIIGAAVFLIINAFSVKRSLEGYFNSVEPINLQLNPILVFFFPVFYFQYHFNRINTWKTTGTLPQ